MKREEATSSSTSSSSSSIKVHLAEQQDALWKSFSAHTTEMVVTKTGRKMFPKLEYIIRGLDEETHYALVIQIEPVDESRYKFSNGEWQTSGRADHQAEPKRIWHADGVMSGKQWMATPVAFDRVKITNNPKDTCPSHIYLHSMHKYIPVLSIFESPSNSPFLMPQQTTHCVATCRLPYTEFIAVTAYQNQSVTSLKIAHNPFAKGFRDGVSTTTTTTTAATSSSSSSSSSSCEGSTRKRGSTSSADDDDSSSQVSSPQPKKMRSDESTTPTTPPLPMLPNYPPTINPFLLPYSPFLFQHLTAMAMACHHPNPAVAAATSIPATATATATPPANFLQFSPFAMTTPFFSPLQFPTTSPVIKSESAGDNS